MKKFTKIMSAAVLAAASLSLSGCQDEDFGFNAEEISYKKNFTALYGKIDPEQDWNLAGRYGVTVSTNGASDVNIYAKGAAGYSIVGHYKGVSGTQTLYFDAIKGCSDIMVSCGSMTQTTTVGGSVSFTGTRAAVTTGNSDGSGITVAQLPSSSPFDATTLGLDADGYKELTLGQVRGYDAIVPEGQNNLERVIKDFSFVATGEGSTVTYVIYPVWSCTSQTHSIGIYWFDENGDQHNKLIYSFAKTSDAHDGDGDCDIEVYKPNYSGVYQWLGIGSLQHPDNITSLMNGALKFRSKGFTLTVPKGLEFGMYSTSGAGTFYSEAKYNETVCATHPSHASVFTLSGKTYFAFEDWTGSDSDMDMNDFILMFDNYNPTVVNKETPQWVIAYEDLGNTFDLDFNDVVIKVEHTSGEETANVYPLAAGGTLASNVYFTPASGDQVDLGEIHNWLNSETGASGSLTPTNVSPSGLTIGLDAINAKKQEITVGADWSLAYLTTELVSGATTTESNNMGGFELRVTPAGSSSNSAEVNKAIYAVSAPAKGETPQMICLPYNWRNEGAAGATQSTWGWATETMPMSQAFSNWSAWVANHSQSIDWYKFANATGTTYPGETNVTATVGGTNAVITEDETDKADCPLSVNVAIPDGQTLPLITMAKYNQMATLGVQSVSMGEVTYSYCDENGAAVPASEAIIILDYDFGFVRAVGGGTCYIKVSQAADNDYKAGYKIVKVESTLTSPDAKILKDGVIYNDKQKRLQVGETWTVTGSKQGNGAVTWSSTSDAVATVSNGTITGVSFGECDIVYTVDGDWTYSLGVAKVHIIVSKPDPVLTFTCSESVNLLPGASCEIGASVANGGGTISYRSNSQEITVTDAGLIQVSSTAEINSTATIYVSVAETDNYASDTKEILVTVKEAENPVKKTEVTENIKNGYTFDPNDFPATCTKAKITFTHDSTNNRFYTAFNVNGSWSSNIENSTPDSAISHDLSPAELAAAKEGKLSLDDYGYGTIEKAIKITIETE